MENVQKRKAHPKIAKVLSLSADRKTVKVEIPRVVVAPKYGKRLHRVTRLLADAGSVEGIVVGKNVKILPCRPISKTKSWRIVSVE
jgi:small subunit ribosomal protein S17